MDRMNLKGKDIILRPVAPRDKSRFMKGIQQLSTDTLFLRFLSPIRELSSSQVDYLLNVDFEDHYAFAAVVDEPSYPGMAITRYIRSFENPSEAEWAVTVVDKYQGLGLGRVLLYLMNLVEESGYFDCRLLMNMEFGRLMRRFIPQIVASLHGWKN